MFKLPKFFFGLWLGAMLVTFPFAFAFLFIATGRMPIPGVSKSQLVNVSEALARVRALTEKALEQ